MAGSPNITERGTDGVAFEKPIPASQPGDVFPAGVVLFYAGASAPTGWIICDGSEVSRATYPTLFTNIGTTWGVGNGSTTFNLPDFRDRIPVGKSGTRALASSGGVETVALSTAEMPTHSHGITDLSHSHETADVDYLNLNLQGGVFNANFLVSPGFGGTPYLYSTSASFAGVTVQNAGSGSAHTNMQPYRAINYIIRAY